MRSWKDLQSRRDEQLSNLVQKIITGELNLENLSHLFPIINRDQNHAQMR